MSKLIGIDLGTTNSCVSVMEGNECVIIPNENGERTTPSVVAFTKEGERLIGGPAKRQLVTNPERTIISIKREMGSDYRKEIDGKKYTPQEISAMILQKLKMNAEEYLGEPATEAVITVPAYFSDSQRQATKDAGKIAGLNVQRIINEPTAAALAYGINKEQDQKVLVYDLGGGTFDVSILSISSGIIEVLATAGNNRLGGDDFDNVITEYLVSEFKKSSKCDVRKDLAAMSRIREAAEKAKKELSSMNSTNINIPFLATGKNGPSHLDITLTREKFNELTKHLVEATLGPVKQAMQDARITNSDISKVLLVGGSTRIPAVQELIKRETGKEPFKGINPDECVAMGACLQAGVLSGQVQGLILVDVTPLSLGIETIGGVFSKIINRNSKLPIKKSEIYTTAGNFQTSVEIKVFQGERELTRGNKLIGNFKLNGIKRALRGVPQIEVTFEIDANGILNVSAKDLGTGKAQDITITASSNLSQEEINKAIQDAKRYEEEDRRKKAETRAKNTADSLIFRANQISRKLNKEDKEKLEEAISKLKKAKKGKDSVEILNACEEIEPIISMLENNIKTDNNHNNSSDNTTNNSGPEVYDAEYKDEE